MNPNLLLLMSILSFFGCGKKAPEYPADTLTTRDGTQITLTFFKHASLAIEAGGKYIYVDPVSGYADYAALPKADVVLITHSHYDHLDVAAVEAIQTPQTEILCDRTSAEAFEMNCYTMRPGSVATPRTCNSIPKTARTAAISSPSAARASTSPAIPNPRPN